MLQHLSKARFIKDISDFTMQKTWSYKGVYPAIIIFHDSVHLYEKGLRDVYEPMQKEFPNIHFFQVLIDRDTEIAHAYGVHRSPTTMFIPLVGKPIFIAGFLTSEEVRDNLKLLEEGKV